MSWHKIESFTVSNDEQYIYAGTISGEILTINTKNFEVLSRTQSHVGKISAMASHTSLPYLATRVGGWRINLWKQDSQGKIKHLFEINLRKLDSNDKTSVIEAADQAIAFHSNTSRLVTRSSQNSVVEIEFDESGFQIINCLNVDLNYPIVTVRYLVNSHKILVGTSPGKVFLVENGMILKIWHLSDEDIHWFEHIGGNTYLVAGDSRQVIQLDTSGSEPPLIGSTFAQDDFEHIAYDRATGEAFASSFDRNIYVIDPLICEPIRILWKAPFKCRWIYILKTHPHTLIVQCRNGGLYKIDTLNSDVIAEIKETPNALWTASKSSDGRIFIAGEGNKFAELKPYDASNLHRRMTSFLAQQVELKFLSNSYTKRLAVNQKTGMLAFGRTDGEILIYQNGISQPLIQLESAIRDLQFDNQLPFLYVACEDGKLIKLSTSNGSIVNCWHSELPIWALALNEDKRILAASEREGKLIFIDLETFLPIKAESSHTYSKRMKWVDENTLLYGSDDRILKYNVLTETSCSYVNNTGNSIEDFAWDNNKKYLAMINYNRRIILCDYLTGNVLDRVYDQIDFSHGIIWIDDEINKSGDSNEFFTFGRTGELCFYKVYEDCIVSNGNLDLLV